MKMQPTGKNIGKGWQKCRTYVRNEKEDNLISNKKKKKAKEEKKKKLK